MSRVTVEFNGVSAGAVAAARMGLARSESLKAANEMGTMLKGLGLGPPRAAAMSLAVTKLATDIGALRHTDPGTVLTAFEGALAGRTRGLKQFGIFIDKA